MSINLRSGLIRLAYSNPSLRADILPLIAKHAGDDEAMGDMDTELEAEGDPTSHDQNLPEHYYFGKTAEERLENIEKLLSQFASPASKGQNKPQSYYGLPPKGKQAAAPKLAGGANYDPHEDDEYVSVRNEVLAALAKKFKDTKKDVAENSMHIGDTKYSMHGEWVEGGGPLGFSEKRIQVPTRAEYVAAVVKLIVDAQKKGKQASVKTAAGPDAVGRNWKEKNDGGKHRWVWAGQSGDLAFTVTEHQAPFGMYYKMSVLLNDGTMLQTVGQKLDRAEWFKRAAAIYRASQGVMLDFSDMPEKWKRMASSKTAMDFPSEEALKQYLRDHPNADKKNHKVRKDTTYEKHHAKVQGAVEDKFNDVTKHLSDAGLSEDEAFGDREMSALGQKWFSVTKVKLNDAKKSADREKLNAAEREMGDIANKMKARITELAKTNKGKQASVKTAGGSGAANAAFLRQSPLKNKILQSVAKHYNTSVSAMLSELTDPDAEALYEYIGDDAGLQMMVYREFKAKGF